MSGPNDPEGWHPNRGTCPAHLRGTDKRVWVRLRNGNVAGPWPADGRGKVLWKPAGDYPFDIMEWKEANT